MNIQYPEIGICGLSCRLCPSFHTEGASRCSGCKSDYRMGAGCPFITCAVKKKGIEFCWQCAEAETCQRWAGHRRFSLEHDTFVCYQKLEANIVFVQQHGLESFEAEQKQREQILREMLADFNEGRSKRFYSIAATVMETEELEAALNRARRDSQGMETREKAKVLHEILNSIASETHYLLSLRKWKE